MHRFTTLALALLPSIIIAQQPIPCNSEADCPTDTNTTCVIPSNGPGTCLPSCTLTSDARPCELGQRCDALPQISTMQIGYCPEPATCGGFIGAACEDDRNPICIDDPRDDCDPNNGGADCGGICVATTKTPTPPTDQSCGGFTGKPCPAGYTCQDNPKDSCDPKKGGADCPGICVKDRLCDSRGLPPCLKGEKCVHKPGCDGAVDCPGVCRPKH